MSDDPWIAADQGDFLHLGLCDEQTVKRIALALAAELDEGQTAIGGCVSYGDGEKSKPLCPQLLGPLLGNFELAQRGFDRDLEERAGAEERLLRASNRLTRGIRQPRVVG